MSGEKLAALAFVEPQARFNLSDVETSGEESSDGFLLNGFKASDRGFLCRLFSRPSSHIRKYS